MGDDDSDANRERCDWREWGGRERDGKVARLNTVGKRNSKTHM